MFLTIESLERVPTSNPSWFSRFSHFLMEVRCGKRGFAIVAANTIAVSILSGSLAIEGTWGEVLGWSSAAVILPSMALFGPSDYFYYLPQPLRMGLGFVIAWASVKVNENGAWEGRYADWAHFDDHLLVKGLKNFFKEKEINTIMDCGCGTGFYVKQLQADNFEVYGCDGNPDTSKLDNEYLLVADLSKPNFLTGSQQDNKKFDCVMSLEVAEHLPPQFEDIFLNNLIKITQDDGWIILSWAKKGQGGLGHVNEQDEEYVLRRMSEKGWAHQKQEADQLRLQTSPNTFWFHETIYVFRRSEDHVN
jgi:2-polyprenyl-3-methyl-5-hydroxy-6-metoxy-1,4-benzoquinol methylase